MGGRGVEPGRNTLQSKVSQLRRALADPGLVAAATVATRSRSTRAASMRWRSRVWPSRRPDAPASGDAAAAVDAATDALALFRGDVLGDAGDGDWLQPHRARLDEVRLGLVEDQMAARVALVPAATRSASSRAW